MDTIVNLQPVLEHDHYLLLPLQADDFEELYAVASDPKVWEQHPNKDRWRRDVFTNFFEGALNSGGAFKVIDKDSMAVIGCTRFYDREPENDSIYIGYTFYATNYWGSGANHAVKRMMLTYIFPYVSKVLFHIGAENLRSQISIERLGAIKIDEKEVAYYGEGVKKNFVYLIDKSNWQNLEG